MCYGHMATEYYGFITGDIKNALVDVDMMDPDISLIISSI